MHERAESDVTAVSELAGMLEGMARARVEYKVIACHPVDIDQVEAAVDALGAADRVRVAPTDLAKPGECFVMRDFDKQPFTFGRGT